MFIFLENRVTLSEEREQSKEILEERNRFEMKADQSWNLVELKWGDSTDRLSPQMTPTSNASDRSLNFKWRSVPCDMTEPPNI